MSRREYVEINTNLLDSYELFRLTPSEFRALVTMAIKLALWRDPACDRKVMRRWGVTPARERKLVEFGLIRERGKSGKFTVAIDLVRHKPLKERGRPQAGPGYTYVVQSGDHGPVKIGRTSNHPERRVANLQTAHFDKLHLRTVYQGEEWEAHLHDKFSDLRLNGEWFKPEVLDYLEDVA